MIWLRIAFWALVCAFWLVVIAVSGFITLTCVLEAPAPCIGVIAVVWFAIRLGASHD